MNWKLWILLPILAVVLVLTGVYYQYHQLVHKYDHLPKVVSIPDANLVKKAISAYDGPHPSVMLRPQDNSPLIRIGETGPSEPLFAGPNQYPFLCNTEESLLGQPLVDNQQGNGMPVFLENSSGVKTDTVVGFSKDCNIPTQAWYYYRSEKDDKFYRLESAQSDIATIVVNGRRIPFIVRVEMGTINRFIYSIAALKGEAETIDKPSSSNWNKKLIYQFRGGVGIGRKQGRTSPEFLIKRRADEISRGYAVIYSSANQTSNHYNIWLAEDTALRVKRQFNALYGKEKYVVGIGGSGGAIQQYLIAQNNHSFLDAAITLYSYPDMVTQTIYAFDCELLEYFFDVSDNQNQRWHKWENRRVIQGLNARSGIRNKLAWVYDLALTVRGYKSPSPSGMSECTKSWRGVTQLVNNPKFVHFYPRFEQPVLDQTNWSHWEDLKYFYGTDNEGIANSTFDNVGVQYGLNALKQGQITIPEFLKLNAKIGGWVSQRQMQPERYWGFGGYLPSAELTVWSQHNMTHSRNNRQLIAPRTVGNIEAIQGIYRSGHVFLGQANIPIIDLRHYLDDELDMHHASASLSARARMIDAQGHADNQLIWVARKPNNPLEDAFDVLDKWINNMRVNGHKNAPDFVGLARPASASDRCYSAKGEIIAEGDRVWDGEWNNKSKGECSQTYPFFSVSRTVAGSDWRGDIFKCSLQSIDQAILKGIYGDIPMHRYIEQMRQIFPQGVCDYTKPDMGKPKDMLFVESRNSTLKSPVDTIGGGRQ